MKHAITFWARKGPGVAAMLLIFIVLSCARNQQKRPVPAAVKSYEFEYIGKITKVEPLRSMEGADRARWKVESEVMSIMATNHNDNVPEIGSRNVFFVHSVVLTFGTPGEAILGKVYHIVFDSPFKNPYYGNVEVDAVKQN